MDLILMFFAIVIIFIMGIISGRKLAFLEHKAEETTPDKIAEQMAIKELREYEKNMENIDNYPYNQK